jgi:hypothetical protein
MSVNFRHQAPDRIRRTSPIASRLVDERSASAPATPATTIDTEAPSTIAAVATLLEWLVSVARVIHPAAMAQGSAAAHGLVNVSSA